eukprot:scaffold10832_cov80-Skeletonema_dohrnii-CCMP3373.AAC.1
METTNAAADSSKEASTNTPASPLDATEPLSHDHESHQPRADDSDGSCNQNTSTTTKEDDNNSHDVILPEPSSSNSSSSHDIGLSLSSFDVDAYNSLHRDLNLVPQGGTITSDDGNGNNNDGGGEVPLSNSDGLSQLEPSVALTQQTDASNGDDDVGTADNSKVDDGETQQIEQQQPSTREEQLESRITNLEQSLQQLSQFCQTILLNQQQQQFNHRENSGSSEESATSPITTPTEEDEVNNHQWHNPSTTQYAPLDSPDASLNNRRRLSTMESSSLDGVREEEERGNMQMNSLSVKLGVTPYNNTNNNNITKGNKKKGKELAPNKKTMSMLFLDIEPGQSRGPNLITLDAVAAASDEDDDDGGGNGNDDVAGGSSSSDDGRRSSNVSSSDSSGSSSGSRSGGEEGSVSNSDDEKKEGGSGDKDTPLLHSPSSSPVLHRQASYSSPTLTTVTEKTADATEGEGKESTSSPSLPPSQVLPTRRRSGLSSSLKINPPNHFTKTEESLECQAYTPSHLEALRLRREVGKGRAYSCNDAVVSPPR